MAPIRTNYDSIIFVYSTIEYLADGKHIGLKYTNKRIHEYVMLNQRYYRTKCIDYMDLCNFGLTLPERSQWIKIKMRKLYFMLLLHIAIVLELPNFREWMIDSIE